MNPNCRSTWAARRQRIAELVLVQVEHDRRTALAPQRLEVGGTHQVRHQQDGVALRPRNAAREVQGGAAHAPLPEAGRQRVQFDPVAGVRHQAVGKRPMGPAVKRLQKQHPLWFVRFAPHRGTIAHGPSRAATGAHPHRDRHSTRPAAAVLIRAGDWADWVTWPLTPRPESSARWAIQNVPEGPLRPHKSEDTVKLR